MERVTLEATKREIGKSASSKVRRGGMIPAVVYGKKYEPVTVAVNERTLEQAVSTHSKMNVLIDLAIEGTEKVLARICDYQADVLTRKFTHVDFQVLDLKQKITVEVPLMFTGKAKGVKEGGVLLMDRRSLSVRCLPMAIPEHIDVEITELMIGDSIHMNELKLPEGVECLHEVNFSIVSVIAPMKEEVAAPVAVEGVPVEGAAAAPGAVPGAAPGAAPGAVPATGVKAAPGAAPAAGAKPAPGAAPAKEKK